jgi:hypothetical protein
MLLIVFSCSVLSSLTAADSVRVGETELYIITLDVCHAGDSSLSVNAESPLFVENSPAAGGIEGVRYLYPGHKTAGLLQGPSPDNPPPQA